MSKNYFYSQTDNAEIPLSSTQQTQDHQNHIDTDALFATAEGLATNGHEIVAQIKSEKIRSRSIGVLVPSIHDQITLSMIRGIERWANEAGYSILIAQTQNSYKAEVSNTLSLLASGVEGLIVFPSCETSCFDHFKEVTRKGVPVVSAEKVQSQFFLDEVVVDSYNSGYIPTKHLIDQGCKNITALIDGNTIAHNECARGYADAHSANNLKPKERNLIMWNPQDLVTTISRIEKSLQSNCRPDGIVCTNHLLATKIMELAKTSEITIPNELAIVSFSDNYFSFATDPDLSTVSYPAAKAGYIAAKQIQSRINSADRVIVSKKVILKTGITVRNSSVRL